MRIAFTLFILFALAACSNRTGEKKNTTTEVKIASVVDSQEIPADQAQREDTTEPIIGERIDGPANVRDAINGKVLFTLNDNVLVSCTPLEKDWYSVGLLMEIDAEELDAKKVRKGRKIIIDGQEAGEIKMDMTAPAWKDDKAAWAELIGYTHKDNIKAATIIENALAEYAEMAGNNRTIEVFENFIQNFELEKADQFQGYTIYYNYENWIEDPSPMWRIGLVFRKGRLVSILHSRPLDIDEATNHKLDRAFDCLVYDDVEQSEEIIEMFNGFVNSVD